MVAIHRFDMGSVPKGSVIVCTARRNSGKTVLMRDVMYHLSRGKGIDFCLAMTPTVSSSDMLKKHMPASCVWPTLELGVIEKLLATQRDLLQQKGKRPRDVLLLLDDLSYDAKAFRAKGNVLGDLWRNGRHAHVTVICTCQAALDLGPDLRGNTDVVFALKEPILANRRKLHEAYFGQLDFASFNACFEKATSDYGALVLNNTLPESDVEACWGWYRASLDLPPFRCCADVVYKLERERRKKQEEEGGAGAKVVVHVPASGSQRPRNTIEVCA